MTMSCSGPLRSRGGGSPRSAARRRRIPKASDEAVRATGAVAVPPSSTMTRRRSLAAS